MLNEAWQLVHVATSVDDREDAAVAATRAWSLLAGFFPTLRRERKLRTSDTGRALPKARSPESPSPGVLFISVSVRCRELAVRGSPIKNSSPPPVLAYT
jgi:hypothetical protein